MGEKGDILNKVFEAEKKKFKKMSSEILFGLAKRKHIFHYEIWQEVVNERKNKQLKKAKTKKRRELEILNKFTEIENFFQELKNDIIQEKLSYDQLLQIHQNLTSLTAKKT